MREILFKAKRTYTGEWVEGYIYRQPPSIQMDGISHWWIHVPPVDPDDKGGVFNVDPETVCQYTGLTDKNGKKIFEVDRIVLDKGEEYKKNGFVSYSNSVFVIQFEKTWDFLCTNLKYAEIIGNIHDKEDSHA